VGDGRVALADAAGERDEQRESVAVF